MPEKENLATMSSKKRGLFARYSLSTMADSNSHAPLIRLRKEKRGVALPRLKFVDKNLSFQDVFTVVYDGDLDVSKTGSFACKLKYLLL